MVLKEFLDFYSNYFIPSGKKSSFEIYYNIKSYTVCNEPTL